MNFNKELQQPILKYMSRKEDSLEAQRQDKSLELDAWEACCDCILDVERAINANFGKN